jgi:pimeloyl-ACP methyl ester carboxylesterase
MREEIVSVGGGRIDLRVQVAGEGPPVVFLHNAGGLVWDPFLEALAQERTIHAPLVPGTSPDDPDAIDEVRDLAELVLVVDDGLAALGLTGADLVGSSFGGMLACELQATLPGRYGKLVALDPIGLWRDDAPVTNWLMTPPQELPALLFADPAAAPPPDLSPDAIALATWTLGCTSKFVWPVPDRGLDRRLHRITAPTLVIWGAQDALVPAVYAQEFGNRIAGARVEVLERCGHVPQVEKQAETLALVTEFLR